MTLNEFFKLFQSFKPLIGMVHLLPLPGSPGYKGSLEEVIARAVEDVKALENGGIDGLLVENYGDVPFVPSEVGPETVAAMTVVVREILKKTKKPLGINVLRNDSIASMAMATTLDCYFIRVNVHVGVVATDQGLIEGKAFETLRYRAILKSRVYIFADVFVKHGKNMDQTTISQAARDGVVRGLADGVIVTGGATGNQIDIDDLMEVKYAVSDVPVLAGSGVDAEKLPDILSIGDGVIVGTSIKKNGKTENPVDEAKVRELVDVRNKILGIS